MSEEQLEELQEYNLEYLEAQQSEEIFGGDYTSAIELKYARKEIEKLKKQNEETNNRALKIFKGNIEREREIERLNNTINEYEEKTQMLDSVCRSLEFSAPENDYIFKERLREIIDKLKELKEKKDE